MKKPWEKKGRRGRGKPHSLHPVPKRPILLLPPDRFERPAGEGLTIGLINGMEWPRVRLTELAHAKMRALVHECETEIGWLSSCSDTPDGDIVIDDVFVPHQFCSMATTEITEYGEGEMLSSLMAAGQIDVIRRLRCWGHSHVNMTVFASGTDEEQTQCFLEKGHPFFVRLIANKRDELFCSLYLMERNMVLHNAPLDVEAAPYDDYIEWARGEIDQKVTQERLTNDSVSIGEFDLEQIDEGVLLDWFDRGLIDEGTLELLSGTTQHRETTP